MVVPRSRSGQIVVQPKGNTCNMRCMVVLVAFVASSCVIGVRGRAWYKQFLHPDDPNRKTLETVRDFSSITRSSPIVQDYKKERLLLETDFGTIKIDLRPDFSPESIDYIHSMAQQPCEKCYIYGTRTTTPSSLIGIILGSMVNENDNVVPFPEKGPCPKGLERVKNRCPDNTVCDCHGPVLTKGMVAWSSGKTGPSFLINTFDIPASWWGTRHTVFGEIHDEQSWSLLLKIFDLPGRAHPQRRAKEQTVKETVKILKRLIRYEMKVVEIQV